MNVYDFKCYTTKDAKGVIDNMLKYTPTPLHKHLYIPQPINNERNKNK